MLDPGIFVKKVGDLSVVVPCVEVCFYLDTTEDALILDCYKSAREALGAAATHFQAESMKGYSPLNSRGEGMVASWFTQPRKGKLNYSMFVSDGDQDEQVSASTFYLSIFRRPEEETTEKVREEWAKTYEKSRRQVPRPASMLRLTLPLDHPLANWDKLYAWITGLPLVKRSQSLTGHCGLALNHFRQIARPDLQVPAEQTLASLVLRYSGLGWHGGAVQAHILPYHPKTNTFVLQLKRANWLLLACDSSLSHLGGRESVGRYVSGNAACTLLEMDHGIVLRSGDAPQTGDIGQRDFLPLYREGASLIRSLRVSKLDGLGAQFGQAATNEWLNALDKEYS